MILETTNVIMTLDELIEMENELEEEEEEEEEEVDEEEEEEEDEEEEDEELEEEEEDDDDDDDNEEEEEEEEEDNLFNNDKNMSDFRICSIITPIYIKFENIIELQLESLFYIKNNYSGNNIGAEGAEYLSNSLQYNSSLLALDLVCFLFA